MSLTPTELFPEVPNLYEFPSVHCDMIYDERRVSTYEQAIRRAVKPGDVVVDIGTGTGLLAFLSLQAGAAKVYAVERSPVIKCAKELAVVNGFADRIIFHHSDSRDTELGERVDVIVSELIGHVAFEEGLVETLFDAKQRFLKPHGRIIPETVTLYACPVSECLVYPSCIDIWKSVSGIDYSAMRARAVKTSYVTDISERDLVTDYQPIFFVDLEQSVLPEVHVQRTFRAHRRAEINGMALWFDATLVDPIRLSSGPWAKTHWHQCFAPIPEPISVQSGDGLHVTIDMKLRTRSSERFVFTVDIRKETSFAAKKEKTHSTSSAASAY